MTLTEKGRCSVGPVPGQFFRLYRRDQSLMDCPRLANDYDFLLRMAQLPAQIEIASIGAVTFVEISHGFQERSADHYGGQGNTFGSLARGWLQRRVRCRWCRQHTH